VSLRVRLDVRAVLTTNSFIFWNVPSCSGSVQTFRWNILQATGTSLCCLLGLPFEPQYVPPNLQMSTRLHSVTFHSHHSSCSLWQRLTVTRDRYNVPSSSLQQVLAFPNRAVPSNKSLGFAIRDVPQNKSLDFANRAVPSSKYLVLLTELFPPISPLVLLTELFLPISPLVLLTELFLPISPCFC
jgi:hypothetical protein